MPGQGLADMQIPGHHSLIPGWCEAAGGQKQDTSGSRNRDDLIRRTLIQENNTTKGHGLITVNTGSTTPG